MNRRQLLKAIAAAPMAAAAISWTDADVHAASRAADDALQAAKRTNRPYAPKFFTAHEWGTVSLMVDLIIPRDDKSGSATEAAVPEFMDFMMVDTPARQSAMRGGLAWIDHECQQRHDKSFVACTDVQRAAMLDDISWPRKARPEMAAGVAFFNSFRDLTASGFFTSKMGMADLQYQGNTFVPNWTGCPPEALKKLGL